MKKIKISNGDIAKLSNASQYDFPKYTTQIINLVNGNAGGTRPKVVGQMSELIQQFDGKSMEEWIKWYTEKKPTAIKDATDKVYTMYLQMKDAFNSIDRNMVEEWVKDLVYNKTYCGLKFQGAILQLLAEQYETTWRLAEVEEEAKGIDGYVGEVAVQIKSVTYKVEGHLSEVIDVPIVYYEKAKDGIKIEFDENIFADEKG